MVGVAAAATLLLGALLRPSAPTPAPSAETPAPMLQQVVGQREAETIFRRMRDAWPRVARFTARLTPVPPPDDAFETGPQDPLYATERFGVIVGATRILGDIADLGEGAAVRVTLGDGRAFEATVVLRFPERALGIVEAPDSVRLDSPPTAESVTAGTALFAAAPHKNGEVIAPLFVAHVSDRELLTTNNLHPFRGMAAFTLDAELVGIVAYEHNEVRLLALDAALEPPLPDLPEPIPPPQP
jgi:hypothetical protein